MDERQLTSLGDVRPAAATGTDVDALSRSLAELQADVDRLTQENEGLVQEVLRTYEQLNLIFGVTAQLAVLTDPREVKRLLINRLSAILNADHVGYLEEKPPPGSPCAAFASALQDDAGLRRLIEEVRGENRVAARTVLADWDASRRPWYGVAGPLAASEEGQATIVCALRRAAEFEAAEMMLLDSVLTFAGHALRNLALMNRLRRTSFETVRALVNAMDKKDAYTCGHSERVGMLARLVGREMGLPPEALQELEWAGLLHDIGKIGIPERILNKAGRLTDEEYAIIKQHPQMSYDVLKPVASLGRVLDAVVQHHEDWDGGGYPRGLKGEEISILARILRVVDVYDALTSARSYRGAYGNDRAMAIIRKDSGTKLDPKVVEKFVELMDRMQTSHWAPELEEIFAQPAAAAREPLAAGGPQTP